jgi:hypothetical protein
MVVFPVSISNRGKTE